MKRRTNPKVIEKWIRWLEKWIERNRLDEDRWIQQTTLADIQQDREYWTSAGTDYDLTSVIPSVSYGLQLEKVLKITGA